MVAADMMQRSRALEQKGKFYEIYKKTLRFDAVDRFDSFMLYLELDREAAKRFYQPRRKVLKRFVDALQALEDDKLDELHLSCPPRIGKTSLIIFFLLWVMGRDSERSNLYCSYSDTITAGFYNGAIEILSDPQTYHFAEIFPTSDLKGTNAKEEYFDLDRKKHYHSLTCRSLYGTLNGACDASGYIVADDLISGIEEALNKDRLKSAWDKVNNNLLTRGKEKTKIIFIGTRWSLADPIGVRREMLANDDKFKYLRTQIIDIPALDENEQSNFDYDYGVGFSTERYQAVRSSFERTNDLASWDAQYMQKPVERTGSLFEPDAMRYYSGVLPETEPDRIIMVVDPAYGAGDYVAAPVVYQYGSDCYVVDVVFSPENKKVTIPLICDMAIKHNVSAMQIEATKATKEFPNDVQQFLSDNGKRINLTTKAASTQSTKQDRVFAQAPIIIDNFVFLSSGCRSRDYQKFMEQMFAFKVIGKNVHDDAPDAVAMAADMIFRQNQKVEVFRRLF
jgi:predicted phage terminase large subunit-like protein